MKRKITFLLCFVIILSLLGCGKVNNEDKSDQDRIDLSTVDNEQDTKETISNSFTNIDYLDLDNALLLQKKEDKYIYSDNSCKPLKDVKLKSCYPTIGNKTDVIDIYGNNITDRFIKDASIDNILSYEKYDSSYVILTNTVKETPTSTDVSFTLYDETGNSLFEFNQSACAAFLSEYEIQTLKEYSSISYENDNVFCIYKHDSNDTPISINIDSGKIYPGSGIFSNGYAIYDDKIIDVDGNNIYPDNDEAHNIISGSSDMGDGLFYSHNQIAFYNYKLEKIIDLSEFSWLEDKNYEFVFDNGYCVITVGNDTDTNFECILDTAGRKVLDFTDELSYIGNVSEVSEDYLIFFAIGVDGKIEQQNKNCCEWIYNVNTKELKQNPVYLSPLEKHVYTYIYNNKMYYLNNSDELCSYDFTTDKLEEVTL